MADFLDESIREKYWQYFTNDPLEFTRKAVDRNAFPLPLKGFCYNDTEKRVLLAFLKFALAPMIEITFSPLSFIDISRRSAVLSNPNFDIISFTFISITPRNTPFWKGL